MNTSISLQSNYFYGLLPLWILGIFLFISTIRFIVNKRKAKKAISKVTAASSAIKHVTPSLQDKYISVLRDLKDACERQEIDSKEAYVRLSLFLREFITKATGMDVTKKTLAEIKLMNLYQVEQLMQEYYEPEFSEDYKGNIISSIDKTIAVIDKWS